METKQNEKKESSLKGYLVLILASIIIVYVLKLNNSNDNRKMFEVSEEERNETYRKVNELTNELIKNQFDSINDSNIYLVKYVKSNMVNPNSFEHIKTEWSKSPKFIVVRMLYVEKDKKGRKILKHIKAELDVWGDILQVLESGIVNQSATN